MNSHSSTRAMEMTCPDTLVMRLPPWAKRSRTLFSVSSYNLEYHKINSRLMVGKAFFDSFITHGTPSNTSSYSTDVPADVAEFLAKWPSWTPHNRVQANLNQTGGTLTTGTDAHDPYKHVIKTYVNPGLVPDFNLVNGYSWEGGRGRRCDFWKSIGAAVPEK